LRALDLPPVSSQALLALADSSTRSPDVPHFKPLSASCTDTLFLWRLIRSYVFLLMFLLVVQSLPLVVSVDLPFPRVVQSQQTTPIRISSSSLPPVWGRLLPWLSGFSFRGHSMFIFFFRATRTRSQRPPQPPPPTPPPPAPPPTPLLSAPLTLREFGSKLYLPSHISSFRWLRFIAFHCVPFNCPYRPTSPQSWAIYHI